MDSQDAVIGILLCTYNGGNYLDEQLESIARQTYSEWQLVISDDGSTDNTVEVAKRFMDAHPDQTHLIRGQGSGFAQNFMLATSNPPFAAKYWAFCDQDDVWEPDKLARAVDVLHKVPLEAPSLYCSRTSLIDSQSNEFGLSPISNVTPGFKNALVQNIASGNTMVFNEAARRLLIEANHESVPFHDWLLYLVVTGCGGHVFYDPYPSVRYRQHGGNVVGYWGGIRGYLVRAVILFRGVFKSWIDGNLKAMNRIKSSLTMPNLEILYAFSDMRHKGLAHRFIALNRLGIHHQNPLAIILATIFNKL
jgi:glycosyltransferase involved in cell wall biosynthesis